MAQSKLYNKKVEIYLLALIAQYPDIIPEIDNIYITSSDFYFVFFKDLYSLIVKLYYDNVKIEPAILILHSESIASRPKKFKDFIKFLFKCPVKKENLNSYVKIIKNYSFKRQLIITLEQARQKMLRAEDALTSLGIIEQEIYDFVYKNVQDDRLRLLSDGVESVLRDLSENPEIGLTTGLPSLDKVIGHGMRRGTINVIGARPGIGKSMIALWIALKNAREGIPVLYLDTELTYEYQVMRMIGMLARIPFEELETGNWRYKSDYVEQYKTAREVLKSLPLYWVYIGGMPVEQIIGIIRRFINKDVGFDKNGQYRRCLICYDYLKLMNVNDKGFNLKEYEALGYRMSAMHDLMVKYKATMLMTVQLNRDGVEREDDTVVSGSDRIMWLASSAAILKPKTQEEININKNAGNYKLIVVKTRFGPGMRFGEHIGLLVDKSCGHFADMGLVKIVK